MKSRLDKLLVERGLVASRERAQAMILAGRVLVNEQKADKPGTSFDSGVTVRLIGEDLRYVSRGGLKLEHAFDVWKIDVAGLACADIGASTGGFTDCMLQRGAVSVLAVDTGYGQIHNKLRLDERVSLMERTNARLLEPGALVRAQGVEKPVPGGDDEQEKQEQGRIAFFAMDVSFISATLVLPAVVGALAPAGETWQGQAVVLVKPQFEAGRENVGKGGIVRSVEAQEWSVERVRECVEGIGGQVMAVMDSPILGMEGNREFLLWARWGH